MSTSVHSPQSTVHSRRLLINALSARSRNVLWRMNLTNRDDIRRAIKDRVLHPSNTGAFGFGWKSLAEVRAWLDLRPDITNKEIHLLRSEFAFIMRKRGNSFREIARVLRLRGPDEARGLCAGFLRKSRAVRERSGA